METGWEEEGKEGKRKDILGVNIIKSITCIHVQIYKQESKAKERTFCIFD